MNSSDELSLETSADVKTGSSKNTDLPFVYLNQYFNYKTINNEILQINDVAYDLTDFSIINNSSSENKILEVTLKENFLAFSKVLKFQTYSNKTKQFVSVSSEKKGELHLIKLDPQAENDFLCLSPENQFTSFKFCKSLNPKLEIGLSNITLNEEPINDEGNIILTSTENKILFSANYKNTDFISIQTRKRNVLPAKINKTAGSEDFKIQFVDAEKSRYAWEDKININQNFFNLKFDNLINLKQGIFFKNNVTVEQGVSQILIEKAKVQQKYYNRLIVSPLIVFEELAGKSATVDALLRSDIGFGFSGSIEHYLENKQNIFGAVAFYLTKLSPTASNANIIDGQTTVLSMQGGYRYTLSDSWSVAGILRLEENLFLNQFDSNTVILTKGISKMAGIAPEFTFYNKNNWLATIDAGLFVMMPTDVKNSTTTAMGNYFSGNVKASYKVKWGRVTAGATLGSRSQKNSEYTYVGSTVIYRMGLNYLF